VIQTSDPDNGIEWKGFRRVEWHVGIRKWRETGEVEGAAWTRLGAIHKLAVILEVIPNSSSHGLADRMKATMPWLFVNRWDDSMILV